jgi:hypothetical protein
MQIETPSASLRFYSELQDVDRPEGVEMMLTTTSVERGELNHTGMKWSKTDRVRIWTQEVPGVGTFFVRGAHFLLPAGFKTIWQTEPYPAARP